MGDKNMVKELSVDEREARAAVVRFYEALEALLTGRGCALMKEAWHHTPNVTAGHPMGDWSRGWDEVLATWETVSAIGAPAYAGTSIQDLEVHLYGELAYTTCVFISAPPFGSARVNCTNVVHKDGGVWKLVHHHADKSEKIGKSLETIAETGALP
jgi:ketosteroid isomerase-like protein